MSLSEGGSRKKGFTALDGVIPSYIKKGKELQKVLSQYGAKFGSEHDGEDHKANLDPKEREETFKNITDEGKKLLKGFEVDLKKNMEYLEKEKVLFELEKEDLNGLSILITC